MPYPHRVRQLARSAVARRPIDLISKTSQQHILSGEWIGHSAHRRGACTMMSALVQAMPGTKAHGENHRWPRVRTGVLLAHRVRVMVSPRA